MSLPNLACSNSGFATDRPTLPVPVWTAQGCFSGGQPALSIVAAILDADIATAVFYSAAGGVEARAFLVRMWGEAG